MKNLPEKQSNFLLYTSQKGKININVVLFNETVWLNRHQMAELYDRDIKTIGKHINNIFKEEEFSCRKFATTAEDGKIEIISLEKYLVTSRKFLYGLSVICLSCIFYSC